jgi:hypothetical protein
METGSSDVSRRKTTTSCQIKVLVIILIAFFVEYHKLERTRYIMRKLI